MERMTNGKTIITKGYYDQFGPFKGYRKMTKKELIEAYPDLAEAPKVEAKKPKKENTKKNSTSEAQI